MTNIKKITTIAAVLILIGLVGSILSFRFMDESDFSTIEETVNIDNVTKIDIKSQNAKVNLHPTSNSEPDAKILFEGATSNYNMTTDVVDSTLVVTVKQTKRRFINFNFFADQLTITVNVPDKLFEEIKLESNNGRVDAANLQANDLYVKTNNGKINLKEFSGETATAESANGAIDLKNMETSAVQVSASNGNIRLDDVHGVLIGKTKNGSITLLTSSLDRAIDLNTSNGKIRIETEERPTNVIFDVKTKNGSVRIFGDKDWDSVIGNGDNLVKLTTANGGITVEN